MRPVAPGKGQDRLGSREAPLEAFQQNATGLPLLSARKSYCRFGRPALALIAMNSARNPFP